jgi:hypothetical protein
VAGGVAEVNFGGKSGGVGYGALEEGLGFGEFLEVDQGVGVVIEEGGVWGIAVWGILRGGGDECGVQGFSLVILLAAGIKTGEEAGKVRVFGVGGVDLESDGEGLAGFSLLLVKGGELGVEGGVVGIFGEGGCEEGLGLIGFLLLEEEAGQGGGGVVVLRVDGEEAAVGDFGGSGVAGGFGEFAREKDVVGGFGGELEGGEEFIAGDGWIGGLVDTGEGAEGAGFEGRVVGVEGRGFEEFSVGEGEFAAASEEEAEGEVSVEVVGVGGDGAPVGGLGGWGVGEGVLGEGEIVEEVGVVGGFFGEGGEELEGGGVVVLVEGFVGLG